MAVVDTGTVGHAGEMVRMVGAGLHFARLATFVGKEGAARWGRVRVTISAVGWHDGERFVMATDSDGVVILGEPQDFTVPQRNRKRAK